MPGEIIISHLASPTDTIYKILSPHYTHCILDGVCSSSSVSPLARDSSAATQWPCEHSLIVSKPEWHESPIRRPGPSMVRPDPVQEQKAAQPGPTKKFGLVGWAGKSWKGRDGPGHLSKVGRPMGRMGWGRATLVHPRKLTLIWPSHLLEVKPAAMTIRRMCTISTQKT